MAKIFTTVIRKIRRIIAGGGGGNGFVASVVKAGISVSNRFTLTASEVKPGVSVDAGRVEFRGETQTPAVSAALLGVSGDVAKPTASAGVQSAASLRAASGTLVNAAAAVAQSLRSFMGQAQNIGAATVLLGATGTPASPEVKPGMQHSARISDFTQQQKPAGEIVQIKYDLVRRVGADAVTETAVGGRTDWANDANAIGLNNGTLASMTGNALGARAGQLELSYPNAVNKTDLTITSAKLHFYGSVTGTTLNNADVQLKYDIGAGFVTLETITGDAAFTATPKTHDISASLTTWAQHDALRAACYASAAALELWVANLDAVELELTATRTDTV